MSDEQLERFEFAFPGPLRDKLVAAVLEGKKTTTTGLLLDYEVSGDEVPVIGSRSAMIDSDGNEVGVLEVTEVRIMRLADVDLQHAIDEGEGHTTIADWRADHEKFWHGEEMRAALGDPDFTVDDDTVVVTERFRLVKRLPA